MIAEAYAMVPAGLGRYRAVRLTGVIAEQVTNLEPEGRGEPFALGAQRIDSDLHVRHRRARRGK